MLFSQKSFRQFFSVRPNRRRSTCTAPAHVQILDSKVLLTATVVEPPVIEPPVIEPPLVNAPIAEPPVVQPPVIVPPVAAPAADESPITEPPEIDPPVVNATIDTVTVETTYKDHIKIEGTVKGFEGHVPGLRIEFGGALVGTAVLSGPDFVAVQTNGTFTASFHFEGTGTALFILKDSVGNTIDTFAKAV